MKLEFTINAKEIFSNLEKNIRKAAREAIEEMAEAQIVNIKKRVGRGVGLDDAKMDGYKESTKKSRQREGRQTGKRNLSNTGKMLRSMKVTEIKENDKGFEATIGFSNREDAVKAFHNQRREPWFGISKKDEKVLEKIAEDRLSKDLTE